ILPYDADAAAIRTFAPAGVILSGGPESVHEPGAPRIDDAILEAGAPVLGICYGMQALAAKLGGAVVPSSHREYGYAEVALAGNDPLLQGLVGGDSRLKVWMSHGDRVERLPDGVVAIASTPSAPLAAMAYV